MARRKRSEIGKLVAVAAMVSAGFVPSCGARTSSEPGPQASSAPVPEPPPSGAAAATGADVAAGADAGAKAEAPLDPVPDFPTGKPRGTYAEDVVTFVRGKLPKGGEVEAGDPAPRVVHTMSAGDSAASLAKAYFDVTAYAKEEELAQALAKKNPGMRAGAKVEIPGVVKRPYGDPDKDRLGWPDDHALRGVFITGPYAVIRWTDTMDRLAARGLNAVVLDAKDYMGPVNYPTKAKIAVETEAAKAGARLADYARIVRVAHERGVRVIARIPCFHDPHSANKRTDIGFQGTWGGPFKMGWFDPTQKEAQDYVIELAKEQMDMGVDEIQLDYVRFPVHPGTQKAIMPRGPGERKKVIHDFVQRVHEVTKARGVPLSLDLFGVVATGVPDDLEKLGQDITMLAPVCEAISPMLYPSHYSDGYLGYEHPGDHPEVIGVGTKASVVKLPKGSKTVIRSWLQAFPWRAPSYGPAYVVNQGKQAEQNGGKGWLMWSPANDYWPVWKGFPVLPGATDAPSAPKANAKPGGVAGK